jgi:hypothetical protein
MEEAESDAAVDAAVKKDNDSKGFGVGHGAREIMGMEVVEDRDCHGCGVCLNRQGRTLYSFEEMGFVGVGLWVVLVRERWIWRRERWVLREREERFGVGAAMEDGGKKK